MLHVALCTCCCCCCCQAARLLEQGILAPPTRPHCLQQQAQHCCCCCCWQTASRRPWTAALTCSALAGPCRSRTASPHCGTQTAAASEQQKQCPPEAPAHALRGKQGSTTWKLSIQWSSGQLPNNTACSTQIIWHCAALPCKALLVLCCVNALLQLLLLQQHKQRPT
jgi:hypothetical protein